MTNILIKTARVLLGIERLRLHVAKNLAEGLAQEIQRCSALKAEYVKIGVRGAVGAAMIEKSLKVARKAQADGDVVAMLRAYRGLRKNK